MARAYLVLENGRVFEGEGFGAAAEAQGELVFTTAMAGYLETLTDPGYDGQIVVQTFPLIGNYGVIPEDFESAGPKLSGYVVREWCDAPSNFRSQGDLDAFLRRAGVPGLWGIDTRALTRVLRAAGVTRAKIAEAPEARFEAPPPGSGVLRVTAREITTETPGAVTCRVALWDFGAKARVKKALLRRGCAVTTYPADTPAARILEDKPDGIMLSNGPGDPAANGAIIQEVGKAAKAGVPLFGIGLGHQLLALSQGARTHKLPFGHRGANQPVREVSTGRVYITSQNHGYAVNAESLPAGLAESFQNESDGSNEGIFYRDFPAFSVQFHPEACAGPLDTGYLFDDFMKKMGR